MNANIKIKNKKLINNEPVGDIYVKSSGYLKAINCGTELNSRAIDELPVLFLLCAKAKGISFFKKIGELRHKESDRLKVCSKFLRNIGIKIVEKNESLKIYGNPDLKLEKKYNIKNFMKDHRIFMMSCVAALTLGGKFRINDKNSIKTSFPNFILTLKKLGANIN
jgi:3-phosphoshikimate 1-carboxyvinyltransferase